jgi:hypothetical protein
MRARYLTRAILAAAAAAAVAAPVASAATPDLVQIGGKLVAPSQVSSTQLGLGNDEATRLVQIGGQLVQPARLSSWQSHPVALPAPVIASSSSGSADFSWSDAGVGAAGGAAAVLLLASSAFVVRKRRIVTAT